MLSQNEQDYVVFYIRSFSLNLSSKPGIGNLRSVQAYLVLLCFTDAAFFHKLKVCSNLASSGSVCTIFPIAFAHIVSVCHILVILEIFQTFHYSVSYGGP